MRYVTCNSHILEQRKDDRVVIVFMGYGELEEQIKRVAGHSNRVFFHPAVPPRELSNFTVSADVGISFIENTCLSYYFCMPNKLFEYAMASLAIIVSDMKEMREFVEKFDIGLVVKGAGEAAINETIDRLVKMDLSILKKNARKAAENQDWDIQEINMLRVYADMGFVINK